MQISTYDNTITAREYLGYISECAGGFAFIGRDGKLYIRTIYQDEQQISADLLGDFKWGEQCKITKVSYENGVESFKFGNDTGNNLWINQDNMYIVDENEVENIYNEINGLIAYSFEGRTVIDPALDVGDKLIIDGKPVIYQGETDFQTRFIAEISSKISIKQKQETTVKIASQKVINRKVQSRIDEEAGKIEQLVKEIGDRSDKETSITADIDGLTSKVSQSVSYRNDVQGTTQIHITDAGATEILSLEIQGNKTYEANLFPSEDLYPSTELYPNMEVL